MAPNILQNLFHTGSNSMVFNVQACANRDELKKLIELGGGHALFDKEDGIFTITIANCIHDVDKIDWTSDIFSSDFIMSCCIYNEIVPLRNFWIKNSGRFPKTFDPIDVLLHKTSWRDAVEIFSSNSKRGQKSVNYYSGIVVINQMIPQLKLPRIDISEKAKILQENASENIDSDVSSEGSCSTPYVRCRNNYFQYEREGIVEYIVKHRLFKHLKNMEMWKRMEKFFPSHSALSLKNHFMRKILPNIEMYAVTEQDIQKMRQGAVAVGAQHSSYDDDLEVMDCLSDSSTSSSYKRRNEKNPEISNSPQAVRFSSNTEASPVDVKENGAEESQFSYSNNENMDISQKLFEDTSSTRSGTNQENKEISLEEEKGNLPCNFGIENLEYLDGSDENSSNEDNISIFSVATVELETECNVQKSHHPSESIRLSPEGRTQPSSQNSSPSSVGVSIVQDCDWTFQGMNMDFTTDRNADKSPKEFVTEGCNLENAQNRSKFSPNSSLCVELSLNPDYSCANSSRMSLDRSSDLSEPENATTFTRQEKIPSDSFHCASSVSKITIGIQTEDFEQEESFCNQSLCNFCKLPCALQNQKRDFSATFKCASQDAAIQTDPTQSDNGSKLVKRTPKRTAKYQLDSCSSDLDSPQISPVLARTRTASKQDQRHTRSGKRYRISF